ncbi:WD domain-containing protein [Phyllosticta capitalensis]
MSTDRGQLQRRPSASRSTSSRKRSDSNSSPLPPPAPSITPKAAELEPCAATAAYFLYAQRNTILCLHHDTLAIERRFTRHREDVSWIIVDNVSERGAGRLVVSYDVGNTTIVWDLLTGDEVSRFAAFEQITTATFMRNGNVAFGNSQGNVILFEPSTSEHISSKTIFDPITSLAPASDCRTFAIGYLNGSILIASLQPSFTILHTLNTPRLPSPIINLAWHGSSSKQKSDMLATQSADGDLRVWSVPKPPSSEAPCVIRILGRPENRDGGPCWFGWSKNGRIVQYSEGSTCSWDVRTKKVTYDVVPTIDGVVGLSNYGPGAVLFTIGRNHTVQQYDINPNNTPMLVANVQHVPGPLPPSPPNSIEEEKQKRQEESFSEVNPVLPVYLDAQSSEGEGSTMSPLQKIAQEMDQLEEERRDRVGPLSPVSSRGSTSSRSSGGSRKQMYRYDKPSSRTYEESDGTVFSSGSSYRSGSSWRGRDRESMSMRSTTSFASSKHRSTKSSSLRKELLRDPDDSGEPSQDLFPFTKARLHDVPFRMPQPGAAKSADELRQQMLSVVFGWDDDIELLVREELKNHQAGSASGVLLSKWLGDAGSDLMASMIGSESMSSSDWMLLALSSMGHDSQKKVGQAFVQRLLEKGDVHPAAAILLGLGEPNEAVEAYVARKYYLEATLLTCLLFPEDWQRISFLVRKWGEVAVTSGQPELAVRCFYCTSMAVADPWSSPRAQDAVQQSQAQLEESQLSPSLSPPSAGPSRVKNSGLKLFTTFGNSSLMPPAAEEHTAMGVTPIAQSALSPTGGNNPWLRPSRGMREPSSARTATPGAYRRARGPSREDFGRGNMADATPIVTVDDETPIPRSAVKDPHYDREFETESLPSVSENEASEVESKKSHNAGPEPQLLSAVAYDPSESAKKEAALPSPAYGIFEHLKKESRSRNGSRDRKPDGLFLDVVETVVDNGAPSSTNSQSGYLTGRGAELSPPLTSNSVKSAKIRSIDQYISSLEEANYHVRKVSRTRGTSSERSGHASRNDRSRERSQTRGRSGVRYIRPAKRSPSSPVPMSPEDAALYSSSNNENDTYDDERYYKVTSPSESRAPRSRSRSRLRTGSKVRSSSKMSRRAESSDRRARVGKTSRAASRNASRHRTPEGRRTSGGKEHNFFAMVQSPASPAPMSSDPKFYTSDGDDAAEITSPLRVRQRSSSRRPHGSRAGSRQGSPERLQPREYSHSRKTSLKESDDRPESPQSLPSSRQGPRMRMPRLQTDFSGLTEAEKLSQKERAARELEERRLSLARRPSAPVIPHPQELTRPQMSGRSLTDLSNSPLSYLPPLSSHSDKTIQRSQTVDPDNMMRYPLKNTSGISTKSIPIGLPATPRALRHPRYMSADPHEREAVPAVPEIPENVVEVNVDGGSVKREYGEMQDDIAPLLPSTVYGGSQDLRRSVSAPPEHAFGHQRQGSLSGRGNNSNKRISPPPVTASIDATMYGSNDQIIVVGEPQAPPPLLAELQHLATPPPPPPPPSVFSGMPQERGPGSGTIHIAIDESPNHNHGNLSRTTTPSMAPPNDLPHADTFAMSGSPPSARGSPQLHRRGRGSVSESIGSRLRGVTDRMRSTSRQRAKSPPQPDPSSFTPSPYESVLPPFPAFKPAGGRDEAAGSANPGLYARSPLSESKNASAERLPPPPPPPPGVGGSPTHMEQVIPPERAEVVGGEGSGARREARGQGYVRNPKEIRANMPPESLQMGVSGMI